MTPGERRFERQPRDRAGAPKTVRPVSHGISPGRASLPRAPLRRRGTAERFDRPCGPTAGGSVDSTVSANRTDDGSQRSERRRPASADVSRGVRSAGRPAPDRRRQGTGSRAGGSVARAAGRCRRRTARRQHGAPLGDLPGCGGACRSAACRGRRRRRRERLRHHPARAGMRERRRRHGEAPAGCRRQPEHRPGDRGATPPDMRSHGRGGRGPAPARGRCRGRRTVERPDGTHPGSRRTAAGNRAGADCARGRRRGPAPGAATRH